MKRPEITEEQGEVLCKLVEFQNKQEELLTFALVRYGDPVTYLVGNAYKATGISPVSRETIGLWEQLGFIMPTYESSSCRFQLKRKAEDYAKHMWKPGFFRWLSETTAEWSTEVRAGIIALVVSLLVNYLPSFVKWIASLLK
jgi:hypothetical protein